MSIIEEDFLKKLEMLVDKKLIYTLSSSEVSVKLGSEISISARRGLNYNYKIYLTERADRQKVVQCNSKKELKFHIARIVYNNFNKNDLYMYSSEFRKATNIEELLPLLRKYCKEELYALGTLEPGKICLLENSKNNYDILYCKSDSENLLIEGNIPSSRAYLRFYNEISYLEFTLTFKRKYIGFFGIENLPIDEFERNLI